MENDNLQFDYEKNRIQEFAVQFFDRYVRMDDIVLPVGQASTEILNLPTEIRKELYERSGELADFLTGRFADPRTKKDAALAKELQERVNPVQEVLWQIPPYCHMQIDKDVARNIWVAWCEGLPEEFQDIFRAGSAANRAFQTFANSMLNAFHEIFEFREKVGAMLAVYFEPLEKRTPAAYARAAHDYIEAGRALDDLDDLLRGRLVFKMQQTRDAMVEYVPMENPEVPGDYVIAERMLFHSVGEFLHMDLFRALMAGNAPRRCHNCGSYFLLTKGYNTVYCNNIAPRETEKTCRKVGAHRKERMQANRSPISTEYKRVYNRLKTRKNRGNITAEEWNTAVAHIAELKDRAERGELDEFQLKELYDKI